MGSVYRARDLHFPNVVKLVAVKEIVNKAPDPHVRETIVKNFEREANILVTLNHPAIPKIFDFFSSDERSYLVLELIMGKDLEALLRSTVEPIQEKQAILWAIEVCDVLEYLHTHKPEPIIFRDIKPQNLMVNQHNHIVMVDFGIAKIFTMVQKGTMIGTEGYSPPEQYRGEATFQTDIYALGATLHHILTRRDPRLEAPFSFADRPIRKTNPNVSEELETIINTCLNYKPEDRYTDIKTLRTALLSLARNTGLLINNGKSDLLNRDQEIKPIWAFQCEDEVRGSAVTENGRVYFGAYDKNLYALEAGNGQCLWKYATNGAITSKPLILNDQLFFGSEDSNLYSIHSSNGKDIWSFKTNGPVRSSARSSEGHLFFGSDDGYLYAVEVLTSRKSWSVHVDGAIRTTPCISNDLIFFGTESNEFICTDFRGQVRWRFSTKKPVTASPTVSEGVVFFTSLDGFCYALDSKSGWLIWKFRMGKGSVSSPALVDNLLFMGSADGFLYCLDRSNAKEIWRFKADHQVSGSPLLFNGNVYFGAADGSLYCLEQKTGRQKWRFLSGGAITGTPVVSNDVIYIGSADHFMYALMA